MIVNFLLFTIFPPYFAQLNAGLFLQQAFAFNQVFTFNNTSFNLLAYELPLIKP